MVTLTLIYLVVNIPILKNWTSQFFILVLFVYLFHFYHILIEISIQANSVDPDQTPRFAASDLCVHCLPIAPLHGTPGLYGLKDIKCHRQNVRTVFGLKFYCLMLFWNIVCRFHKNQSTGNWGQILRQSYRYSRILVCYQTNHNITFKSLLHLKQIIIL